MNLNKVSIESAKLLKHLDYPQEDCVEYYTPWQKSYEIRLYSEKPNEGYPDYGWETSFAAPSTQDALD